MSVINVIPNALSGETNQDSEPNLAVNPADPRQIAASAFTPNPAGVGNAPIFISEDGGATWRINMIVRSQVSTGDISLRFTRTTNTLYAGILRRPGGLRMSIQSTADFTDPTPMTVLVDRTAPPLGPDQPYVQATDVGGTDRVYVGNNDLGEAPRSASVDQTVDGATWTIEQVEQRPTQSQDLPAVRPAIGPGNVVYVAWFGQRPGGDEVVVTRDDNGAIGANPYRSLLGSDGQPGVRVATGLNVPFENFSHANFGQERLVSSDLSIAVDPADAARVCVAWGDRQPGATLTLHLRCSTDSGATWSARDVRRVDDAKNPALAFNSAATLGLLYQAVEGQSWVTRFERFERDFSRRGSTELARTPANRPIPQFLPYLGDYLHLMALDRTFYGIFSAANTPDNANFPNGVTYQREADFGAGVLRGLGGAEVAVSIDPFFFTARE